MISFSKYGYRSAAEFLRARNVSAWTFRQMAKDDWPIAKRALKHPECPMDVRDRFRNSKHWYKRISAIGAQVAPVGYIEYAKNDPDVRVRTFYKKYLFSKSCLIVNFLFELGMKQL